MMLGAVQGFAADGGSMPVNPPAKPTPLLVKVGDDYFIDFKDGRVAAITQTIGKAVRTFVGLRQIENTCDYNQVLSNCRLQVDLATRTLKVEWAKHPDPSKIGQVVTNYYQNSDGTRVGETKLIDENGFVTWYETLTDKTYAGKFQPDQLICDNFAWAKDIPVLNARMKIDAWATEAMFETNETKMNENQSVSAAYDVILKKTNATTFDFEKIGPSQGFGTLPPYFATQVASLTFIDKNKKQCQVSFEASIENVIKELSKSEFKALDPSTRTGLRTGTPLTNSILIFYLRNISGTNPSEFE
ncbi:hypothetical protein D3C87_1191640 [compost metagenome]